MLISLLAWLALLSSGLGGTAGVVSQALTGKLNASAQLLQRHSGTSPSSRAVRREWPAPAAKATIAEDAATAIDTPPDGVAHWLSLVLPAVEPPSGVQATASMEPRPASRKRLPPSRAPPFLV